MSEWWVDTSSHVVLEALGKRVSINIHVAGNVQGIIGFMLILMGFNPLETKFQMEASQPVGDLAENISIMAKTSSFSARFLRAVDLCDGSLVVDPREQRLE